MIVTMVQDDVSAQVEAFYREASEARERGDMDGFFDYSHKALEVVNRWIDRQQCRQRTLSSNFMGAIGKGDDPRQIEIAYNCLELAILRVEVGLGEPKLDLRTLNKHLLNKAI